MGLPVLLTVHFLYETAQRQCVQVLQADASRKSFLQLPLQENGACKKSSSTAVNWLATCSISVDFSSQKQHLFVDGRVPPNGDLERPDGGMNFLRIHGNV